MFGKLSITLIGAYALLANGAIIEMFSDSECQNSEGTRNVWDNSCATGVPGFKSYIITVPGGSGQYVSTYSPDACAYAHISCNSAADVGVCYSSFDSAGGSNAISSGAGCGAF
jgi:hypothetical protein